MKYYINPISQHNPSSLLTQFTIRTRTTQINAITKSQSMYELHYNSTFIKTLCVVDGSQQPLGPPKCEHISTKLKVESNAWVLFTHSGLRFSGKQHVRSWRDEAERDEAHAAVSQRFRTFRSGLTSSIPIVLLQNWKFHHSVRCSSSLTIAFAVGITRSTDHCKGIGAVKRQPIAARLGKRKECKKNEMNDFPPYYFHVQLQAAISSTLLQQDRDAEINTYSS